MNFVNADLVRDDGAAVTFAGYKLPVPAEVVDAKPGLEDFFGKQLILGIRPSDFEDAASPTRLGADAASPPGSPRSSARRST